MTTKAFFGEFVTVFAVTLLTSAIVTLIWNYALRGAIAVDWETAFRLAGILGIGVPLTNLLHSRNSNPRL